MANVLIDIEGGSNLNSGDSVSVTASGSDGELGAGDTFQSASAPFLPEHVGRMLMVRPDPIGSPTWHEHYRITGYVSATRVTVSYYTEAYVPYAMTGQAWVLGGPWGSFSYDKDGRSLNDTGGLDVAVDSMRVKKSPDPYLIGNVAWEYDDHRLVMPSPVAQMVEAAESSWTPANSATSSTAATYGGGRVSASPTYITFPSGRTTNTKYAHKTLASTLDLSSWSRLILFALLTSTTQGAIRVCLCSDTSGNVIVAEATLPQFNSTVDLQLRPVVLDFGGPLPSVVNSIAIYTGASIPAVSTLYLNHIQAVKAAGDPLEFTYTTLIGKEHKLAWSPTTAYALGKIRQPTPINRNGMRFVVTTAGTTGGSEPTWPTQVGDTVSDGSVVWECEGPEDTWYGVCRVLNGTDVYLMKGWSSISPAYYSAGQIALFDRFYTETETVPTYFRQAAKVGYDSYEGVHCLGLSVSGGWNSAFTAVEGETWIHARGRSTYGVVGLTYGYPVTIKNIGVCGYQSGFYFGRSNTFENVQASACDTGGSSYEGSGASEDSTATGVTFARCRYGTTGTHPYMTPVYRRASVHSNSVHGMLVSEGTHRDIWVRRNGPASGAMVPSGLLFHSASDAPIDVHRLHTEDNDVGSLSYYLFGFLPDAAGFARNNTNPITLYDADIGEGLPVRLYQARRGRVSFVHPNGTTDVFSISSGIDLRRVTDGNRHTPSGGAWRLQSMQYDEYALSRSRPHEVPFDVAVRAGEAVTISLWVKRSSTTDHEVSFGLRANPFMGVDEEIFDVATAAADTYEQLSVTFTPSVTMIARLVLRHWADVDAGVKYTYFDDLEVV